MRIIVVPAVPALLSDYAGLTDPVAELRGACATAVEWLLSSANDRMVVVGEPAHSLANRIATDLLGACGHEGRLDTESLQGADGVIIVANGTACRSEKAPGHIDERSFGFDSELGAALKTGDLEALAALDTGLGRELLAAGLPELRAVASGLDSWHTAEMLYDADPYGVQYWVVTAQCES